MAQLRLSEPKNLAPDRKDMSPLTLEDFTGFFLVLIIGHLLLFLVLIAENLVNKNNTRRGFEAANNVRLVMLCLCEYLKFLQIYRCCINVANA